MTTKENWDKSLANLKEPLGDFLKENLGGEVKELFGKTMVYSYYYYCSEDGGYWDDDTDVKAINEAIGSSDEDYIEFEEIMCLFQKELNKNGETLWKNEGC